jgi:predicted CXXCH cytochrome family protein
MEKGCLSCHSPHSAPNAKLLVKVPPELCLSCHDKEIHEKEETIPSIKGFFVGHVHAPVSKGECYKCHQIHGSKADFLLQKSYSPSLYDPFTTSNFELCFQCHKKALAETRNTTTDTNFRNGDLNLHALHLANQSKQRTCRACHEIHSSTQARLIRDAFTYKDIQLPIQYTPSDQGGKCATACHHDMIYNRDKAFKNERQ